MALTLEPGQRPRSFPSPAWRAGAAEVIKTETSKWAKDVIGGNHGFAWQSGYGVFSVSYSNLDEVERYIKNQEMHHAKRNYQDEFRLLCEKLGIEIDERYVWD